MISVKRKGDLEIDKTFAVVLAVIALAVLVYVLFGLSTNATGLFELLFK